MTTTTTETTYTKAGTDAKLAAKADYPAGGSDGQALIKSGTSTAWTTLSAGSTPADATTTSKGIVQLGGDLAGTAAAPALKTILGASGTVGTASQIPVISFDTKGRITATSTVAAAGGSGGGSNSTQDHIRYVSKSGSDANNGLSWSTPYLTVAAALTALATSPGIVYIGAGTFDESGLVINQQQRLIGAGRYATTLRLAASGTLINLVGQSDGGIEDLCLAFASSAVTGKLLYLSNSFRFSMRGVRFTGTTTVGQIGTHLDANAGDSTFYDCYYASLGVHVQNDTAVNYWFGGSWGSHATAGYQSGSVDGSDTHDKSAVLTGITFLGSGPAYVNLNGYSSMHTFNGCWWDGSATTAIVVGNASFGPHLVAIRDSPNIAGVTTTLLINRVGRMVVDGNLFGDTGTHPTVVSIPTPANVPNGWCGQNYNLNAATIASFFPNTWKFGA